MIVVRTAVGDDLAAAMALRDEVFVGEQGVPADLERDGADPTAHHVVAVDADRVVGTGRLVVEPTGYAAIDPALGPVGHIGRLAVAAPDRGRGIGAALVSRLEEQAAAAGLLVVALGAQVQAIGFYEALGYQAVGDEFDDAGIPHRTMIRGLATRTPAAPA